jgi:predicted small secreted protein
VTVVRAIGIACALAVLAACNTIEGFGQDVQAGGRAIEKAASKNRK